MSNQSGTTASSKLPRSRAVLDLQSEKTFNRFVGACLLITGTCVGAGMLSIPVETAQAGFLPTVLYFLVLWVLSMFASLYMLEVNAWFPRDTNYITMARETLGKFGAVVAWFVYILFLYALIAAYTSSGSALMSQALTHVMGFEIPKSIAAIFFAGIFAGVIFIGTICADYINRFFIAGLMAAYFTLLFSAIPKVDPVQLQGANEPVSLWMATPILFTSFAFQNVIPSLRDYLKGDHLTMRTAIWIGSFLPFIIYMLWEFVTLGVIPAKGDGGLMHMLASGEPVIPLTQAFDTILGNPVVSASARFFTFFAVTSSLIGVSLGLFDFLADGLQWQKRRFGPRVGLILLTFIPPLLFAELYPKGFIRALGYAGVLGAILLILLPAMMTISGRYVLKIAKGYRVRGGILPLIIALLYGISIIFIEFIQ